MVQQGVAYRVDVNYVWDYWRIRGQYGLLYN